MRYPPGHKQRTHQRILDTAARLFRKRGYAATGVDAVMTSAGLTAGGFYAHFRSKQALLAEALELAFQRSRDHWRSRLQGREGPAWVRAHITSYLSQEHRDAAEHGCPMPALGAEIARLSPTSREIFEQHLSRLVAALGSKLDPRSPDATPAIPAVALCVGGLLLARAVKDRALSNRILDECRAAALQQIETTAGLGRTS